MRLFPFHWMPAYKYQQRRELTESSGKKEGSNFKLRDAHGSSTSTLCIQYMNGTKKEKNKTGLKGAAQRISGCSRSTGSKGKSYCSVCSLFFFPIIRNQCCISAPVLLFFLGGHNIIPKLNKYWPAQYFFLFTASHFPHICCISWLHF